MSTRAIRALRGESSSNVEDALPSDFDSDDDGSEDLVEPHRTAPISFSILNDESDEDSCNEETERVEDDDDAGGDEFQANPSKILSEKGEIRPDTNQSLTRNSEDEEDIDALLSEFQELDYTQQLHGSLNPSSASNEFFPYDFILKSFDTRDLDIDYTMRTSMMHAASADERFGQPRKSPSSSLFGPPLDGWIRPPRYVGGGIGMTTYGTLKDQTKLEPPWPYDEAKYRISHISSDESIASNVPELSLNRWCTLMFSDLVIRDLQDYFTIQSTGDINAVVMFIAHHPYVTEALLQLSNVLYQANRSAEGLLLLRRCLWIYESSSLPSLVSHILQGKVFLMDSDRKENAIFFKSLFRLIQVSSASGLNRTSLAACRLLISLDPLRDPMNVLLAIDYHTIAVGRENGRREQIDLLQWLVELVELDLIQIWHRDKDEGSSTTCCCSLLELPNWAYSYALALFDLYFVINNGGNDMEVLDSQAIKSKADAAIQTAISRYPAVVGGLLHNLDIDTSGRSFHLDWLPILDKISKAELELLNELHSASQSPLVLSATLQTRDLITKIYIQQSARLFADDNIVQWIYDNSVDLLSKEKFLSSDPPNPAILRYASVDPTDFDVRVEMFPPDANVIDLGLLAHSMVINPNRRRYLRRPHRRIDDGHNELDGNEGVFGNQGQHARLSLFGPPSEMVDPDWPMLEVFWRSLLPWNYVQGMTPPR